MTLTEPIKPHDPGTLVYLTSSLHKGPEELLSILWTLDPEDDEPTEIPKYLTRTSTHGKKVVFHCEVTLHSVVENQRKAA